MVTVQDTIVLSLQNLDTKNKKKSEVCQRTYRNKNIKVMFHVINVGTFMSSLQLDRSFQKLDFSIGTTNTTDKQWAINRPKGWKGFRQGFLWWPIMYKFTWLWVVEKQCFLPALKRFKLNSIQSVRTPTQTEIKGHQKRYPVQPAVKPIPSPEKDT